MRPSSSGSDPLAAGPGAATTDASAEPGLFDGVLARGGVREAVGDRAWLEAMLAFEAALARSLVRAGVIPAEDGDAIERACRIDNFEIAELGRAAAASGTPVLPLVQRLRALVAGPAADAVHLGATSQDVLDTAAMLVASRSTSIIARDLAGAASAAAQLAETHRATPMAGRTLLQHAIPTSFGLKAAGWMSGMDAAADGLERVRRERLAVQLGGVVGTLAGLEGRGLAVLAFMAEELGLSEPILAWHTDRTRIGDLASALGVVAGSVAKPSLDLVLLAQTEIAEARDGTPGRGASSAVAGKLNPVAAVAALACAREAPTLVAALLASMAQEHERAAGAWHAEWSPFRRLLQTVGSAVAWTRDALEHLEVDTAAMRAGLDDGGPMGVSTGDLATTDALIDRGLRAHAARLEHGDTVDRRDRPSPAGPTGNP